MYMSYSIDLHCHPIIKSFGRSFSTREVGINAKDKSKKKSSIWYYDPPQDLLDIPLQKFLD